MAKGNLKPPFPDLWLDPFFYSEDIMNTYDMSSYKYVTADMAKKQIIVIDDDQLVLFGLSKALSDEEKVEVDTAETAADAIEKLRCRLYNLCLLDIHLPDLNGLDLMDIIRDLCPAARIIIMTASYVDSGELNENLQKAQEKGACHFISKPFFLSDVRYAVKLALEEKQEFPADFFFSGDSQKRRPRRFPRKACSKIIKLLITFINEDGDTRRRTIEAELVDQGDGGVGLLSRFPLQVAQVVSFAEDWEGSVGLVRWSTMVDDELCRAGISFACSS